MACYSPSGSVTAATARAFGPCLVVSVTPGAGAPGASYLSDLRYPQGPTALANELVTVSSA